MTIDLFATLLMVFGTATTIGVEFIKSLMAQYGIKRNAPSLALITGACVGGFGTALVYIIKAIPFNTVGIMWIVAEMICVVVGSQVGYDKIIAIIKQMYKE